MPIHHLFLALLVVLVWGGNFIFVKLGLTEIPPLLLCALRFLLASVPAIFFIKPPAAPLRMLISYGFIMFGMQFGFLFLGLNLGMPPGLASILIQIQVFFSILFAVFVLGELPNIWQIVGGLVSFAGIGIVALHIDHNVTLAGFLLITAGAATWGIGNLLTKKMSQVNMMALVVWGSFVACFPLTLLSFMFEGTAAITHCFTHLTWVGIGSLCYIVYASTWIGYGAWNFLISRYDVSVVAPFTLLVPVIAMLCSVVFLHESFQSWKLIAGLLVVTGLCINFLAPRFFGRPVLQPD